MCVLPDHEIGSMSDPVSVTDYNGFIKRTHIGSLVPPIQNYREPLIQPYNSGQLAPSSYDVRLAPVIKVPSASGQPVDLRTPGGSGETIGETRLFAAFVPLRLVLFSRWGRRLLRCGLWHPWRGLRHDSLDDGLLVDNRASRVALAIQERDSGHENGDEAPERCRIAHWGQPASKLGQVRIVLESLFDGGSRIRGLSRRCDRNREFPEPFDGPRREDVQRLAREFVEPIWDGAHGTAVWAWPRFVSHKGARKSSFYGEAGGEDRAAGVTDSWHWRHAPHHMQYGPGNAR